VNRISRSQELLEEAERRFIFSRSYKKKFPTYDIQYDDLFIWRALFRREFLSTGDLYEHFYQRELRRSD
jgi:hypothetical protein